MRMGLGRGVGRRGVGREVAAGGRGAQGVGVVCVRFEHGGSQQQRSEASVQVRETGQASANEKHKRLVSTLP